MLEIVKRLKKFNEQINMAAGEKSGTCSIAYKPGLKPLSTDVCIPISKLPELITFNEQYFKYLGMEGGLFFC